MADEIVLCPAVVENVYDVIQKRKIPVVNGEGKSP